MNVPLEHPTHRFCPLTRSESYKQSILLYSNYCTLNTALRMPESTDRTIITKAQYSVCIHSFCRQYKPILLTVPYRQVVPTVQYCTVSIGVPTIQYCTVSITQIDRKIEAIQVISHRPQVLKSSSRSDLTVFKTKTPE